MRLSAHNRLYIIPWLTDVTSSLFTFTVTRHLAEQGSDPMQMGIVGACGSLGYVISAALCGHLADRVGSRRLIATGSLLMTVVFAVALRGMEVPSLYYLVAASGLQRGDAGHWLPARIPGWRFRQSAHGDPLSLPALPLRAGEFRPAPACDVLGGAR